MFRIIAFLMCGLPLAARAQPPGQVPPTTTTPPEPGPATTTVPEPLPTTTTTPSEPAKPEGDVTTPAGIVEQAGIGSPVAFASRGVLQLGGSASLRAGSETTQFALTPQVGFFIFDHIQISAILDITHLSADMSPDITSFTTLAEPSYHHPFTNEIFGLVGLGLGATWESDLGAALAAVPRVGAEFLIGRSGILTPSLSWQVTTEDEMEKTSALRINLGYSVMW